MSHEMKRKEMQIKELQSRIDSTDGCKYNNNKNSTFTIENNSKIHKTPYEQFIFIIVTQAALAHAVFVMWRHFNLSRCLFGD